MTDMPPGEQLSNLVRSDEVLTPDEAAELLKVSKKTVLRRARLGELPAAKVGRAWRFRRSELLAYLTPGPT